MSYRFPRTGLPIGRAAFVAIMILLLISVPFVAEAQEQVEGVSAPPAVPRQPDVMPQPPTPTLPPAPQEPATIGGERPGYWRSPVPVYPRYAPYPPGFYPHGGYFGWDFHHPPTIHHPRYHPYGNRRSGFVPRYGRGWHGSRWR